MSLPKETFSLTAGSSVTGKITISGFASEQLRHEVGLEGPAMCAIFEDPDEHTFRMVVAFSGAIPANDNEEPKHDLDNLTVEIQVNQQESANPWLSCWVSKAGILATVGVESRIYREAI